ncbi:MAG TPA: molybdopterin molybdotransferase MoeA [Ottowia sp.]|uniref:molybdopterin molybdotransferase MoeA n=1 Tax=Ottowia sp. TaxID=1898956 RepID=UPI002C642F8E|nr:gephyrin-like molybdotransferase Glp [Ottowia sp.]HMN21533.1 molybdopterin molybdotransferase MoeA [Ottowia sp.]
MTSAPTDATATPSGPPARPPLMPLDEALARVLAQATPALEPEWVSTFEADGRVLARDVASGLAVPPLDNSAMDGYAVHAADCAAPGAELGVAQRIAAGSVGTPLAPGSAARIFTGAPVPPGADAVVMQEETQALAEGACVRIQVAVKAGQCIRKAGEDVARGAVILRRGERLTPAGIGLAAGVGLDRLAVARRPRVALLQTGDELVTPGTVAPQDMQPGMIYNSNRFFLRALLQRLGCAVVDQGVVPDDRAATTEALRAAAADCDVLLTSGGVSVGEEDHVKPAVRELGALDLWSIAIKPGKPFACGHVRRADGSAAHFIGLPGNPVSSFITFLLLVRPFLLRLQGVVDVALPTLSMRADFQLGRPDKRREFLRVRRNAEGGLDLFPNQGSGVLTSMHWADGLVDHPAGSTIATGDLVRFIPLSELLA